MVVLELILAMKEDLHWYKEVINYSKENYSFMTNEADAKWNEFNECRICHYIDLYFKRDQVKVIPLRDVI